MGGGQPSQRIPEGVLREAAVAPTGSPSAPANSKCERLATLLAFLHHRIGGHHPTCHVLPGKVRQNSNAKALQSFAASHTKDTMLTTSRRDFPAKKGSTVRVGVPWQEPLAAREFTAKSVYSDTYFKKVKCRSLPTLQSMSAHEEQIQCLPAINVIIEHYCHRRPKPWHCCN